MSALARAHYQQSHLSRRKIPVQYQPWLAKYYSDAISDNVKRAQEQKLRKDEWLPKAPYGYKNIKHENGSTDIIVDDYGPQIVKRPLSFMPLGLSLWISYTKNSRLITVLTGRKALLARYLITLFITVS